MSEIVERGRLAIRVLGPERVPFTPDCGFTTFADNPIASATTARKKLAAVGEAAAILRRDHAPLLSPRS